MREQLEIEFKNLLNEKEFTQLIAHYQINEKEFFIQENFYFDTEKNNLRDHKMALRIRSTPSKNEITLKQPAKEGLLETTVDLSQNEYMAFLRNKNFPVSDLLLEKLTFLGIQQQDLQLIATLKTKRAERLVEGNFLLVFDESWYYDQHDYEFELESLSYSDGLNYFQNFLKTHQIPLRETKNKIIRAIGAHLLITEEEPLRRKNDD